MLERMCQAVGKSYVEAIKTELLEGTRYGVRILKAKRLDGVRLVLRRGFRAFSRKAVKAIHPTDVIAAEKARPAYSDPGYLFTLSDGSFVLLREEDASTLRLSHVPEWAELLRGDDGE